MRPTNLERTASALSKWEGTVLLWLVARLPSWVTPDRLTALGFAGALGCAGGYALAAHSPLGLLVASLGLIINWLGDSLDGALARFRKIERPRYGYFLDNGLDIAGQFVIAVGLGLSGYLRWELCFLALSVLLMMSSLSFIRAYVSPVHKMAYAGFGLTEVRLAGLVMNAMLFLAPPSRFSVGPGWRYPDILLLIWSCATLAVFAGSLASQARELARQEPPRPWPPDPADPDR